MFAETLRRYGVILPETPFAQGDAESGYADDWAVRASLIGATRDVNAVGGLPGYRSSDVGITTGVDRNFDLGAGSGRFGLGFGYLKTKVDAGASSADVEGYYAGLYGGVENGPFSAAASMSYGAQNYDFSRSISLMAGGPAQASGKASGDVFATSLEASYDLAARMGLGQQHGLRLAPTARVDFVHANRGGFAETGAGVLNLTVAPDSISRTWLGVGIAMSARFEADSGPVFMPSLKLFYEHLASGRSTSSATAIPVASASFITPGVFEDADYVSLEAGLDVGLSENVSLHFDYTGAFSGHSNGHSGNFGLRVKF